ncbi:tail tube protein A [Cyanophage BHS3]|nr:tail tube protein A [Cyanophage BHS3]
MANTNSTKTLLEVANDVLLMAGERPTVSLNANPVSRKVASCLREALLEVALLDDWSFLRSRVNALAWTSNVADVGDVQRIVRVIDTDGRTMPYVDVNDMDMGVGGSRCWTVNGYGLVRFSFVPSDDERPNIRFDVIRALQPPNADGDTFPVPDRFMPLVTKRALYLFVLRHLDDAPMAAQYNNEFELMTQMIRNRERYVPRGSVNMYRRRRTS